MVLISVQHSFSSFSSSFQDEEQCYFACIDIPSDCFGFFFTFPHALPLEANPEIITTVTDPMPGSARRFTRSREAANFPSARCECGMK